MTPVVKIMFVRHRNLSQLWSLKVKKLYPRKFSIIMSMQPLR